MADGSEPVRVIPQGFVELPSIKDDFNNAVGPFWIKREGEHLVMGLRVERRHANPIHSCHGAVLMTVADVGLALAALYQMDLDAGFIPTVSLSTDYLAPTPIGSWIESRGDVLKATRNLVFVQGVISADGVPVVRCNAIYKIPSTRGVVDVGRGLKALLA